MIALFRPPGAPPPAEEPEMPSMPRPGHAWRADKLRRLKATAIALAEKARRGRAGRRRGGGAGVMRTFLLTALGGCVAALALDSAALLGAAELLEEISP